MDKYKIQPTVIKEVKEKVQSLSISKRLSVRPVLIHVNGVSESVKKSHYFTQISDLLSDERESF